MAKRNLKVVDSETNDKEFTDAIYHIQTYLGRIKALTRTMDFDAMSGGNNDLSDEDKANISSTIGMLASLCEVTASELEDDFKATVEEERKRMKSIRGKEDAQ